MTLHLDNELCRCASEGDLSALALALSLGANPKAGGAHALCSAASAGHVECVELLIPVSDPESFGSAALYAAVRKGHV